LNSESHGCCSLTCERSSVNNRNDHKCETYHVEDLSEGNMGDISPKGCFGNTSRNCGLPNAQLQAVSVVVSDGRSRTYSESVVGRLVLADVVKQLAVASARDFARRVRDEILGLTRGLVGIECLLQVLALFAGVF
jgi:hypothetical protein